MSYFKGLKLTKLGETLLANINGNLNETLTFTSGEIGAGIINSDDEIRFLTTLKEKWKDLDIISIEKDEKDETIVKLELQFSNIDLKEAKIFREIGIYAKGNNGEPVLFAYSNAGENYDYIPLPQDNPQNFTIQINLKITSNSKIDAIINMAGFVTIGKMIEYLKNKLTQIPTIAELQSRKNLKVGDIVEVLGYYTAGDGAGHKRIISDTDDGTGIKLSNGLYANLVKEQSAPLFYETFLKETRGFVAHRGYSLVAPENTLPAYQKAYENNIFIWETDLEMTSDGHFVLMHDGTVDRTTDGTGRVDSLTLEEVKRLNIDGGANATTIYDGTKVPTFEEWLSLAKRLNCYPFIELKRLGAEEEEIKSVVDIIKKYNMEERTAFISCEKKVLEKVRKFSFKIQVWWIADDITQDTINWCKRTGNAHLDPSWKIVTKEKVLLANSQGVNIAVWTVNDIEDAHKLFDMGVNLVASDWLSEVY